MIAARLSCVTFALVLAAATGCNQHGRYVPVVLPRPERDSSGMYMAGEGPKATGATLYSLKVFDTHTGRYWDAEPGKPQ